MHIVLRAATSADAGTIGDIYLESRKTFLPFAPIAHSDEQVHIWIATRVIPESEVTVAECDGNLVGMMALTRDTESNWLDQLYLLPSSVGRGIGTRLVQRAKRDLGSPIRLYCFQANEGARRFYERLGFEAIEFGDGSGNEEGCPDVLYEWRSSE